MAGYNGELHSFTIASQVGEGKHPVLVYNNSHIFAEHEPWMIMQMLGKDLQDQLMRGFGPDADFEKIVQNAELPIYIHSEKPKEDEDYHFAGDDVAALVAVMAAWWRDKCPERYALHKSLEALKNKARVTNIVYIWNEAFVCNDESDS